MWGRVEVTTRAVKVEALKLCSAYSKVQATIRNRYAVSVPWMPGGRNGRIAQR
jgi:hypothetical protein